MRNRTLRYHTENFRNATNEVLEKLHRAGEEEGETLIISMFKHIKMLQEKVDSQATHIQELNERISSDLRESKSFVTENSDNCNEVKTAL